MFIQSRPFLNSLRIILLLQCLLAGALMFLPVSPSSSSAAAGERNPLRVLIVTDDVKEYLEGLQALKIPAAKRL
jgi:hypothetical protein